MKELYGVIVFFFIALFAYTKLAGPIPFTVTSITTTKTDFFSVTGEGKVSAPPDIAIVTAGAQSQGPTVKAAQDELNKKMNAISAAVKSAGVDPKDIQTSGYSINPTYDYREGDQKITGYQASSNFTIKIRAIDRANGVIDGATAAGATNVSGVSFDVDDKSKAENEARKLAVADAKKKAEDAASIAGFKLGSVINYSENFGDMPRPYALMEAKTIGGAPPVDTQIEPGTNEINLTVTLSYQIQ